MNSAKKQRKTIEWERLETSQENWRYQGNMSCKDRYSRNLTEAEEIKKRRQEYTEELYKEGLNDPENYDGVITHLESDILNCEVTWTLGSITMNKAGGGDGIPAELFQALGDDTVKVLHSICQQKLSSGHSTGKSQFSFQSQRKAMPKNAQTTAQLHSSHTAGVQPRWIQGIRRVDDVGVERLVYLLI